MDPAPIRAHVWGLWQARVHAPGRKPPTAVDQAAAQQATVPLAATPRASPAPPASRRTEWFDHFCDGQFQRLHTPAWEALGVDPGLLRHLRAVEFTYRTPPPTGVDLPNHQSFNIHAGPAAAEMLKTIERGAIELQEEFFPHADPRIPLPQFATVINPMGVTGKKDSAELRPYIDPSITGVNEA